MQDFHVPEIPASPLPSGASQSHSVAAKKEGGVGWVCGGERGANADTVSAGWEPLPLSPSSLSYPG